VASLADTFHGGWGADPLDDGHKYYAAADAYYTLVAYYDQQQKKGQAC
jgi:hypothetical protein